jgi:hypothetical protein
LETGSDVKAVSPIALVAPDFGGETPEFRHEQEIIAIVMKL